MRNPFLKLFVMILAGLWASLPAHALEVAVEVSGPAELASLATGIEKSVYARCVARGIDVSADEQLGISLVQLGGALSFDAVLAGPPPRGFHRDLAGTGELSQAIDDMIAAVFGPPAAARQPPAGLQPPAALEPTAAPARRSPVALDQIELPFAGRSLASDGSRLYIADRDQIYLLEDRQVQPWWEAPRKDEIYRLYVYKDSVLALTRHKDRLHTYRIRDGKTTADWDYVVIPQGEGLVASGLRIAPDITGQSNRWSKPEVIEGTPFEVPAGWDPLVLQIGDVLPSYEGLEYVHFSKQNRLSVSSPKHSIWSSRDKFDHLPYFLEEQYRRKGEVRNKTKFETRELTERYYLAPRILIAKDNTIISIRNDQGLSRMLTNVNVYESSEVVSFRFDGDEVEQKQLAVASIGYCADIATQSGQLIALIVKRGPLSIKEGTSKLQFVRF